jgi:glycosyltransferase involved in cell wall biosynthesis
LASYNKNAQAAIDIYDPGNLTGNITNGRAQFTRRRWDQLNSRRSQYSNIIYVISVINKPVLTQIKQSPGSVVLLPSCLIRTIVNPNHPYTQQLWQIIKWADTISFLSESDVQNIQGLFRFANLPKLFTLKIQDRNTETSNAINISELLGIENSINKYGYLDKLAKSFTLSKVLNDNALRNEAKLFAANFDSRTKSRLLIDVTMTAKFDYRSGIQRVVKELTRSLVRAEFPMPEIQLVRLENQKLLTANRFIEKNHEIPQMTLGQDIEIEVKQGDSILLLDSTWEKYADFIPFLQSIRSLGGRVGTVIYDLIPVQFPQYCVDNLPSVFKKWLKSACEQSDILCCISQDVADNLSAYRLDANIAPEKEIMISSFNLGCDLSVIEHERTIRNEVTKLQKVNGHVYCVIGTLEPRKGHAFILDAFDVLWQGGSENVLIFAGKQGWKVDDLVGRINSHPLINKNLYYFVNPSDAEINLIYEKSQALISASEAEGFGLPIVEAAIHGKPSLVSDIAVFREVGGIGAIYFDRNNVDSLVKCIKEIDQMSSKSLLQMAQSVKCTSWVESSIQLLECFGFRLSPDAFDFKG